MRIAKFALVGLSGVFVNEGLLWFLTEIFGLYYLISSAIGIETAIITNFILNEKWTFRDRVKVKDGGMFRRLYRYNMISIGGLAINITVLYLFTNFLGTHYLISNLLGILFAFFWNYLVNLRFTWSLEKQTNLETGLGRNSRVSLVIPTYNEKENIALLIPEIFRVFRESRIEGEIIIVDDNSPDGTGEVAEKLKNKYSMKVIHRKGKKGLGSAVVDGFRKASGEILGAMDADFSHPVEMIPKLVRPLQENQADFVIASRRVKSGSIENWPLGRRVVSKGATFLARGLTSMKDPVSGFFFIYRNILDLNKLNPKGYKICLEILVKGDHKKAYEVPYTFIDRKKGKSKMDFLEILRYVENLLALYWYKLLQS